MDFSKSIKNGLQYKSLENTRQVVLKPYEIITLKEMDTVNPEIAEFIKEKYPKIDKNKKFIVTKRKIHELVSAKNYKINETQKIYTKINKEIYINNDKSILDFCNTYGLLGADFHFHNKNIFSHAYDKNLNFELKTNDGFFGEFIESYKIFKREITEFKMYLEIWWFLKRGKIKEIENKSKNKLTKHYFELYKNKLKYTDYEKIAKIILLKINEHLYNNRLALNLNDGELQPGFKAEYLLDKAYSELYETIINNNNLKKCKHPDCRAFFEVTKSDQEFCPNDTCQQRYSNSLVPYWKKQYIKGNKTAEEVAERLKLSIEDIKKWKQNN